MQKSESPLKFQEFVAEHWVLKRRRTNNGGDRSSNALRRFKVAFRVCAEPGASKFLQRNNGWDNSSNEFGKIFGFLR